MTGPEPLYTGPQGPGVRALGDDAPSSSRASDRLQDGETLLWRGRPDDKTPFTREAIAQSLRGFAYTAFGIGWLVVVLGGLASVEEPLGQYLLEAITTSPGFVAVVSFLALLGMPFLVMGVWVLTKELKKDFERRRQTWYALTDRRAFIGEGAENFALNVYPITGDMPVGLMWGWRKLPSVVFYRQTIRQLKRSTTRLLENPYRTFTRRRGFEQIAEAHEVHALLKHLVEARR